ncbi:MAG TPA: hypothetical protein VFY17_06365 [Pilimelia sp.]|nr:hypothetical protein [Pilimelia sp.]
MRASDVRAPALPAAEATVPGVCAAALVVAALVVAASPRPAVRVADFLPVEAGVAAFVAVRFPAVAVFLAAVLPVLLGPDAAAFLAAVLVAAVLRPAVAPAAVFAAAPVAVLLPGAAASAAAGAGPAALATPARFVVAFAAFSTAPAFFTVGLFPATAPGGVVAVVRLPAAAEVVRLGAPATAALPRRAVRFVPETVTAFAVPAFRPVPVFTADPGSAGDPDFAAAPASAAARVLLAVPALRAAPVPAVALVAVGVPAFAVRARAPAAGVFPPPVPTGVRVPVPVAPVRPAAVRFAGARPSVAWAARRRAAARALPDSVPDAWFGAAPGAALVAAPVAEGRVVALRATGMWFPPCHSGRTPPEGGRPGGRRRRCALSLAPARRMQMSAPVQWRSAPAQPRAEAGRAAQTLAAPSVRRPCGAPAHRTSASLRLMTTLCPSKPPRAADSRNSSGSSTLEVMRPPPRVSPRLSAGEPATAA